MPGRREEASNAARGGGHRPSRRQCTEERPRPGCGEVVDASVEDVVNDRPSRRDEASTAGRGQGDGPRRRPGPEEQPLHGVGEGLTHQELLALAAGKGTVAPDKPLVDPPEFGDRIKYTDKEPYWIPAAFPTSSQNETGDPYNYLHKEVDLITWDRRCYAQRDGTRRRILHPCIGG